MADTFKIGLKNLHYAIYNSGTDTYGTPKTLAPAVTASITNSQEIVKAFADDKVVATARGAIECEISLETAEIPHDRLAELLGATKDASTGVLTFNESTIAPTVALMFETGLANGEKCMFTFYRGQFRMDDESLATKTESVEFQNTTIVGDFIADDDGVWKRIVRSDDAGAGNDAVIAGWYTAVYTG